MKLAVQVIICVLASSLPVARLVAHTQQPVQSSQSAESHELNARVIKLFSEQKYAEALPLAKRALALGEAELGPNHKDLIPLLLNLGELYRVTQKPSDAKLYYQRALQVGERAFGAEDIRVTKVLDKFAYLALDQNENDKAENFLLRSLAIKEKTLGLEHPEVAETALALGNVYKRQQKYGKAEPFYQRVIQICDKAAVRDDAKLIEAIRGYQPILLAQNRTAEAEQVQQRLIELSSQSGVAEAGIVNGRAIKLVQPAYSSSIPGRTHFVVSVRVLMDETGKVVSASTLDLIFNRKLVASAEDAARHSTFKPAVVSGKAIKAYGTIIYDIFP